MTDTSNTPNQQLAQESGKAGMGKVGATPSHFLAALLDGIRWTKTAIRQIRAALNSN